MCGILFQYQKNGAVDQSRFTHALTTIAHRGPDDHGIEFRGNCALGSRRLAIQDLSLNGHMPLFDTSGRYSLVFNGEVYNFKEILPQLSEYSFKSGNDTEVVLYSYIKWGVDCLAKFRGMFALVVVDMQEQMVFFARDRFGKKPVLFHMNSDELLIASEAKALLALKPELQEFDSDLLADLLSYRYPPNNKTGFRQIESLPAGHFGYGRLGAKIEIKPYWSPTSFVDNTSLTLPEALEKTEELLRQAVKYRLIADVPVGVFLSGGLDSSLITAIASQEYQQKLQTYTVGYSEDDPESELNYAHQVAEQYQTEHHEIRLDLQSLDLPREFVNYFNYIDRPIADPATFPSFLMSREVGKEVKVVLNGDGGDEIFAGYPKLIDAVKIQQYFKIPSVFRQFAYWLSRGVSPRLGFLTEGLLNSPAEAFLYRVGCFHPRISNAYYIDQTRILRPEYQQSAHHFIEDIFNKTNQPYRQSEYYDLLSYMPDDTLPKVDFATMANSLEARSPFLDQDLAEFALTVPYSLKLQDGQLKYLLKKIAEKYLPHNLIYTKKRGFAVPFDRWFRTKLQGYLRETFLSPTSFISSYLNVPVVEKLIDDHRDGVDYSNHLWIMLTLELWGRRWIVK
jgi:asparagine synthase (glutamine-hydrolysing)